MEKIYLNSITKGYYYFAEISRKKYLIILNIQKLMMLCAKIAVLIPQGFWRNLKDFFYKVNCHGILAFLQF